MTMELSDWLRNVFLHHAETDRNKFVERNNIAEYQPFLTISPPMSFSFFFSLEGTGT